ncbi:hypothetical protein Tco_1022803, partial [Tanacetum coccineum]
RVGLVNASRAKRAAKTHDPLSLVANTYASSSSSRSPTPYYVTHLPLVIDYDDDYHGEAICDGQEYSLTTAMMPLPIDHLDTTHDSGSLPVSAFISTANFNVIQSNIKFSYDSEDMELDKEVEYTTDEESGTSKHEALDPAHVNDARSLDEELSSEEDLDEWLKGELEKHMRFEEEELWRSEDEKTDYEPPFVDINTFEVKKYSFKRGQSLICITKHDDDALPLGRVNGARFKAMIRKELKDKGVTHNET